jgi:hypothetical protein
MFETILNSEENITIVLLGYVTYGTTMDCRVNYWCFSGDGYFNRADCFEEGRQ